MLKRNLQHDIDSAAKARFALAVHKWAVANPHSEDYGIDYTVELTDERPKEDFKTMSGLDFQVQLKGSESPDYRDGFVVINFSVRHLVRVANKKRIPVFLVHVDTTSGDGYFLFLQGWAATHLGEDKRSQKTVQIAIPLTNSINDRSSFEHAVRTAVEEMDKLYPGSLKNAIAGMKKQIETANPGTKAELSTSIAITATTPKQASYTVSGEDSERFIRDVFERGKRVTLGDYKVSFEMSGLPQGVPPTTSISQIHFTTGESPGSARLIRIRGSVELASVELQGLWTRGTKTSTLEASVGGVVKLSIECDFQQVGRMTGAFNVQFDQSAWQTNRTVLALPYYDQISRVFLKFSDDDLLRLELYDQGNFIARHDISNISRTWITEVASNVEWVEQIRFICRTTKTTLILPQEVSDADCQQIHYAFLFLNGERIPFPATTVRHSMPIGKLGWKVGETRRQPITLERSPLTFRIFETEIDAGNVSIQCEMASIQVISIADGVVSFDLVPEGAMVASRT